MIPVFRTPLDII